ncbi:hypothetical protein ACFL1B_05445 [Nanoarchaeota archaeon]
MNTELKNKVKQYIHDNYTIEQRDRLLTALHIFNKENGGTEKGS